MASTADKWSRDAAGSSDRPEADIFTLPDPRAIALRLKQSAEENRRRRSTPYRSAMSMLTFHINRAGESLSEAQRAVLERAKDELRIAFGREPRARRT